MPFDPFLGWRRCYKPLTKGLIGQIFRPTVGYLASARWNGEGYMRHSCIDALKLGIAAAVLAAMTAEAKSYKYRYVGHRYTNYSGGSCLNKRQRITMTMVLSAKLPPNLVCNPTGNGLCEGESNGVIGGNTTPVSWTASDGVHTWTSQSGGLETAWNFATDSNANITQWYAGGQAGNGNPFQYVALTTNIEDEAIERDSACDEVAWVITPGIWKQP